MKPLYKGLALALLQLAIVGSLGVKLLHDRATYPRVWARVAPLDPTLPIRGRYVELRLIPGGESLRQPPAPRIGRTDQFIGRMDHLALARTPSYGAVALQVRNGELVAVPDPDGDKPLGGSGVYLWDIGPDSALTPAVLFFIPEHVRDPSDPSLRKAGEELWAEVTVPPKGPPRPLRLGVRKGAGPVQPL